ncbi:MAG TPA: TlpA disulfide reductase family protein [Bryobacteraceae bacterium]|nr:TlpA disulfide reductase family protein [Bryobacteraceae bacterium]
MARWEKPTKEMPAFRLADLDGKVWNLKKLEGKAVLVCVWASWSAPCHILLPKFQHLSDNLKERDDVQVLSLNVDEDLTLAGPFIKKHGYTFPVLPSFVFVGQLVGFLSVPRVWIIDANGRWQWEQIGFDANSAEEWEAEVMRRLEAVLTT